MLRFCAWGPCVGKVFALSAHFSTSKSQIMGIKFPKGYQPLFRSKSGALAGCFSNDCAKQRSLGLLSSSAIMNLYLYQYKEKGLTDDISKERPTHEPFTWISSYSTCQTSLNSLYSTIHSHDHQLINNMQNPNHTLEIVDPSASGTKWASKLLTECAKAIASKDSSRIQYFLWMLNELASPYGDCDQKLASHFLQALFCKATNSADRSYKILSSVAEKSHSFESARKVILKFQEVSPWTTFGHVASNGAILEALEGEPRLHIIDISNTYCTQWPILLESLATRNDETPHLRLTVVVTASTGGSVMKEIGQRMEKFARLMGVPFEFQVVTGFSRLRELKEADFKVREDEAVVINCIGALRRVAVEERRDFIRFLHSLGPKVVTVVEEEADFTSTRDDFVKCFEECLRFYEVFFDMMEESFVPTSNERLMLERESSRSILNVLACGGDIGGDCERREKGNQWCGTMMEVFSPCVFSDDAIDDVKALLKRYKVGWSHVSVQNDVASPGLYLAWKDEPVVWASAWKP